MVPDDHASAKNIFNYCMSIQCESIFRIAPRIELVMTVYIGYFVTILVSEFRRNFAGLIT